MNFRTRNRKLLEQLPALRRYARALTGNQPMADELVQDCYARACSKFNLWRRGSKLRQWMFTMMHNLHVNQVRKTVHHPQTIPVDDADLIAPEDNSTENASELIALDQALNYLSVEQREVLLLVCLEELSYEEVANTLYIPLGTVMSRLSRARENLRKLMSGRQLPKLKRIK